MIQQQPFAVWLKLLKRNNRWILLKWADDLCETFTSCQQVSGSLRWIVHLLQLAELNHFMLKSIYPNLHCTVRYFWGANWSSGLGSSYVIFRDFWHFPATICRCHLCYFFVFYKIILSQIHPHGTCFRMYLILYMVRLSGFVHIPWYAIYKYVAECIHIFFEVFILDFMFKSNSVVMKGFLGRIMFLS